MVVLTDQSAKVVPFSEVWPPMDPTMPSSSLAFKDRAFRGEEQVSAAILQLTHPEKTAVVFVRFGGAPLFLGGFLPGQPPAPYSQVKTRLEELNFQVSEWDLSQQTEPPAIEPKPGRTIYVVLRPTPTQFNPMQQQQPPQFGEEQRAAVLKALGDNPRAMFVAGWYPGQFGGPPGTYEYNDYLKNTWGIQVDADLLLLKATAVGPNQYRFMRQPILMTDAVYGDQPIVRRMSILPAAYPVVTPLTMTEKAPDGAKRYELVRCDRREGLWGVHDVQPYQDQLRNEYIVREPGDLDGPFTIATAAEKGEGKVVVVGARDFAADELAFAREIAATAQGIVLRFRNPGNLTFLINSLHWLNDNEEIMNLGRPIDAASLEIAEGSTRMMVGVLVWAVVPAVVVALGGVVWYARRR